MTTGAPRAICTESCDFFRHECSETYNQAVTLGNAFGYAVSDHCENTLIYLQDNFDFPCSSSSLQNECIDLLGT